MGIILRYRLTGIIPHLTGYLLFLQQQLIVAVPKLILVPVGHMFVPVYPLLQSI
jgi:hypothetical protein